jgi:hypothetical protein
MDFCNTLSPSNTGIVVLRYSPKPPPLYRIGVTASIEDVLGMSMLAGSEVLLSYYPTYSHGQCLFEARLGAPVMVGLEIKLNSFSY